VTPTGPDRKKKGEKTIGESTHPFQVWYRRNPKGPEPHWVRRRTPAKRSDGLQKKKKNTTERTQEKQSGVFQAAADEAGTRFPGPAQRVGEHTELKKKKGGGGKRKNDRGERREGGAASRGRSPKSKAAVTTRGKGDNAGWLLGRKEGTRMHGVVNGTSRLGRTNAPGKVGSNRGRGRENPGTEWSSDREEMGKQPPKIAAPGNLGLKIRGQQMGPRRENCRGGMQKKGQTEGAAFSP